MDRDRGEELLRGRVYGTDFDDPHPGPRSGRAYAELVGGPLDGLLLDITSWTPQDIATGVALRTEIGQFGPGGPRRHCSSDRRTGLTAANNSSAIVDCSQVNSSRASAHERRGANHARGR
ncbi:hypothetical protein [Streptomyces chrestomyceticus]|uniref:hypothetical protein n=1 Tax=Streptomyces chrestomyceticus TaxID=68185 RepID=UPI001F4998FD|nr:hypothetical protein [Streptomyces chrestomyceticus]